MTDETTTSQSPLRLEFFQTAWAIFGLGLFAVTWKLWIPQDLFPQIPMFRSICSVPGLVDIVALSMVALGLIWTAVASFRASPTRLIPLGLFTIGTIVLMALDQHRLQPWAYQFLLISIVLACCRTVSAVFWLRWLTISIYVYSALSKFDYQFVATLGDTFLTELCRHVGMTTENWNPQLKTCVILGFPLGELLVGVGLIFRKTRNTAMVAAAILHGTLLLILGPLGLEHHRGVLLWNLFFIVQGFLLFWETGGKYRNSRAKNESENELEILQQAIPTPESKNRSWREYFAATVMMFALTFPLTETLEVCDHWLAWELYSPRNSRVQMFVTQQAKSKLPPSLQKFTSDPADGWCRVQLNRWSLNRLDVPIYPEDRFQLAVAVAIVKECRLVRQVRVNLQSSANRLSGKRNEKLLVGAEQLEIEAGRFRFSTKPRKNKWSK